MALYSKYFGHSTQQDDNYHGEFDDEAYGALYIPHIEEELATEKAVKRIFAKRNIGTVTTVVFQELAPPTTYKGKNKNKKKAYSAQVYLKWRKNTTADALQEAMVAGDKKNTRLQLDKCQYWVIHYNTVCSDALYEERYCLAELEETALDAAWRILEETEEDLILDELENLAVEMTHF
jgi:hypothetical protein